MAAYQTLTWRWAVLGGEALLGGQSYLYAGSNEATSAGRIADNSGKKTQASCSKAENGYGLCDMTGTCGSGCGTGTTAATTSAALSRIPVALPAARTASTAAAPGATRRCSPAWRTATPTLLATASAFSAFVWRDRRRRRGPRTVGPRPLEEIWTSPRERRPERAKPRGRVERATPGRGLRITPRSGRRPDRDRGRRMQLPSVTVRLDEETGQFPTQPLAIWTAS